MGEQETTKRKIAIIVLLPLMLCSFLSVGYVRGDITTDLYGWYKLDEESGAVAIDYSGNNNHGTISGSPTWVDGKFNSAIYFDVSGSQNFYISYPAAMKTISFWYNVTNVTLVSYQSIYSYSASGVIAQGNEFTRQDVNDWQVYFDLGNGTTMRFHDSNGDIFLTAGTTFHNKVFVLEANYTCSVYDDGILSGNLVSDYSDSSSSPASLYFGGRLEGSLDDIRIYTRILTGSDVAELYAYNPSPTPSPSPSYTPYPEGDMSNTDWWISILVLLLIIINIFLMMLPFALVRFTFGILSLFLCMLALSYQVPLSPYLQTAGLLISALAMLFSVRARE